MIRASERMCEKDEIKKMSSVTTNSVSNRVCCVCVEVCVMCVV